MTVSNFAAAHELVDAPLTCYHLDTSRRHILLPPRHLGNVVAGVQEVLSNELFIYSESLQGVAVAFDKLCFLGSLARVVGSQPCLHVQVQADFIVFRPVIGSTLQGVINKVGKDHLGALVHSQFNATIPRPKDMKYAVGDEVTFTVVKVYQQNGVVSVRGELIPESADPVRGVKRKAAEVDAILAKNAAEMNLNMSNVQPSKRHKSSSLATDSMEWSDSEVPVTPGPDTPSAVEDTHTSSKKKKKKKRKSTGTGDLSDADMQPISSSTPLVSSESQVHGRSKLSKKKKKQKELPVNGDASDSTVDSGIGALSLSPELFSETPKHKLKHKKKKDKKI